MQSCSVAIHYNSLGSKLAAGTTKNAINARGGDAEVFQADLTKVSNASMVPRVLIETPCSRHATDYASVCRIRCFVLKRTSSRPCLTATSQTALVPVLSSRMSKRVDCT